MGSTRVGRYTDILDHPSFTALAAVLRVPIRDEEWRKTHPHFPALARWRDLQDACPPPGVLGNRADMTQALTDFLGRLAAADNRLRPREEDLAWLAGTAEGDDSTFKVTFSMLLAAATCPDEMYTPHELAAVAGGGHSTWRWRAKSGAVPGCMKKGKQWLLPRGVLLNMGMVTPEQAEKLRERGGAVPPNPAPEVNPN